MQYMTAAEAAAKWNISLRSVQRLLASGRIPGAQKLGHGYLLPVSAKKPDDSLISRRQRGEPNHLSQSKPLLQEYEELVAKLLIHAPIDEPDAILGMVHDESLRVMLQTRFAYSRGNFEQVKHLYNEIPGSGVLKLICSGTAIAAAVSLGDYPYFLEIESYLKGIVHAEVGAELTAVAELMLAIAYNGIAINMLPEWLMNGDFIALPVSVRSIAAYTRVQWLSRQKDAQYMLATAQAYLSVYASNDTLASEDIYLRIHCAEACLVLGRKDEARGYLRTALKRSLPHGFITAFAERVAHLSGLCEQLLEHEFPEHFTRVINQFERVTKNWLIFRSLYARDNVPLMLTLQEYEMVQLMAHGLSTQEIAEHFHIAFGTAKNRIDAIYEKLAISGKNRKKELMNYSIF